MNIKDLLSWLNNNWEAVIGLMGAVTLPQILTIVSKFTVDKKMDKKVLRIEKSLQQFESGVGAIFSVKSTVDEMVKNINASVNVPSQIAKSINALLVDFYSKIDELDGLIKKVDRGLKEYEKTKNL